MVDPILLRASRHKLCGEFAKNLALRCGYKSGEGVLIGLSGGVDSTALLLLATALAARDRRHPTLTAVYVHHHLRGEADAERSHCAALCARIGVDFDSVDVHPTRAEKGLAENARRLRLAALGAVAQRKQCQWILLAHQSDDILETLLMRIGRGAGNRGLAAIPWVRRVAPRSPTRIARPLLSVSRIDLVEFCGACGVDWCEDASNARLDSVRGFLRQQVVPALQRKWPRIAQHALRAAEAARGGSWALCEIARRDGWLENEIPRRTLRGHGAVRSAAILTAALRQRSISISPSMIRRIADAACDATLRPRQFHSGKWTITVRSAKLVISANE